MSTGENKLLLFTVPNFLTGFRLVATVPIVYLMFHEQWGAALLLAIFSALTDFFDGRLARSMNQCSYVGSLLDPVADKLFEMLIMAYMCVLGELPFYYVALLWLRHWAQLVSIPVLLGWKKIKFKVIPKFPSRLASAWGMVVILIVLGNLWGQGNSFTVSFLLEYLFIPFSALLELYVLVTYLPRFVQIYRGTHDTFV